MSIAVIGKGVEGLAVGLSLELADGAANLNRRPQQKRQNIHKVPYEIVSIFRLRFELGKRPDL